MIGSHDRYGVSDDAHAEDAPLPDLTGALEAVEAFLLGSAPDLTRAQVAEAAGVPQAVSEELWRLLGFPHAADDDVAFTEADVEALRLTKDLIALGILGPDSQAALVRTWGRSFARLAEWQTTLLARVATSVPGDDPVEQLTTLSAEVLPRVEALQTYVWRRHLASASSRLLAVGSAGSPLVQQAVGFVDIVGFTSRSKAMSEAELVDWIEGFEDTTSGIVVDRGGRVIKNIGDEVLFVADDATAAVEIALEMTARGQDEEDDFPAVRAGVAYGDVVARLGDVFGPTVNIASRLTSLARPGAVLVERNAYEALVEDSSDEDESHSSAYSFRRLRRASVKGYSRLEPWLVRRR
ncbi:MAG: adenylate/guanylate cyclase domain-containing protein [Actinobacteria bacterium]|uniref:Unannotated protein n=1 Tax=freshwater metagenome TaxID=449393 RepID=A0A6J6S5L7_9ZZZZ|nr:adenylate/guanylate cyclase domain-containing protein [Actinomycetota bacterium]